MVAVATRTPAERAQAIRNVLHHWLMGKRVGLSVRCQPDGAVAVRWTGWLTEAEVAGILRTVSITQGVRLERVAA